MYEHERSLVQEYKSKPFVLMGVNTDAKSQLQDIIKDNNLTWNNWADGPPPDFGPIVSDLHVHAFPTMILIDAEGKVRDKSAKAGDLNHEIAVLVKEAEEDGAKNAINAK